jgi:hypothetical protein
MPSICSKYASVPDTYAQGMHQFVTSTLRVRFSSWRVCSACFEGTFSNFIRALSVRISSRRICSVHKPFWCVCLVHASVPDAYAQGASVPDVYAQYTHQFLTRMLRVNKMDIWKIGKLMRMLSMLVRNWCIYSGCISVPDAYAHRAHKGRSIRVRKLIFLNYLIQQNFKDLVALTKWLASRILV